jgi:hypothetical protein
MSELQSEDSGITFDEPEAQEAQTVEAEQPEVDEPSALATDSPVEGEENTTDSVEQENTPEWFQKKINKQTFAQRQAERERDELKTRLEELEQKAQPVLSNVDIPSLPDSWDDNYEAKIQEYANAVQQKARFDASESQRLEGQAEAQRKSEREHFNRQQELSETLASSSKKLGIDKAVLDKSQEVLVKQINDSGRDMTRIVDRLLSDPMGGLMIQHLAANQLDMQDIIYANPEDAGFLLAEVKQKAALLKPQSSNAPSPAATLTGGAVPNKSTGDGATYE